MDSLIMNAEEGKFILKDIIYDVTGVSVYIIFQDMEIILSMDIEAETDNEEVEYELSSVRLYHEEGFNTHTSTFENLKGKKFVLESNSDSNDEGAGSLYVCEHEDVTKGIIEVLDVTDGKFKIHWSGLANVYWDNKYGKNVPFNTVFTVDIPDRKIYRMNAFKSTIIKIDSNTELEVMNIEEFNKEIAKVSRSRQWNDFNTVLKFKVSCGRESYFGEVIFTGGKNNHVTNFDEKCFKQVRLVSVSYNLRANYEIFLFEIE